MSISTCNQDSPVCEYKVKLTCYIDLMITCTLLLCVNDESLNMMHLYGTKCLANVRFTLVSSTVYVQLNTLTYFMNFYERWKTYVSCCKCLLYDLDGTLTCQYVKVKKINSYIGNG